MSKSSLKPLHAHPTQEQRDARKIKKAKVPVKYTDLQPFKKKDFDEFIQVCLDTGSDWLKAFDKGGCTVWNLKSKDQDIKTVKVRVIWKDVEPDMVYDVLHDHEFRECWDENMLDGYAVEIINKTNEVGYYAGKMPKGISNRDFCNKRGWQRRKSDGLWVIINESVNHPYCPEYKGFIRGWSHRTGSLLRKLEGGGCEFVYCTRSEPRGWLPTWAVNWVMTKFTPKLMDKIHSAVLSYGSWKSQSSRANYKPWLDDQQDNPEKKFTKEELQKIKFRGDDIYIPSKKGWDVATEDDDEDEANEKKNMKNSKEDDD